MNEDVSFLSGKKCVLLNFTADTYHWGCFATSIELYSTLIEEGYFVDTRNVMVTQLLEPTPDTIDQFNDPKFFDKFCIDRCSRKVVLNYVLSYAKEKFDCTRLY